MEILSEKTWRAQDGFNCIGYPTCIWVTEHNLDDRHRYLVHLYEKRTPRDIEEGYILAGGTYEEYLAFLEKYNLDIDKLERLPYNEEDFDEDL